MSYKIFHQLFDVKWYGWDQLQVLNNTAVKRCRYTGPFMAQPEHLAVGSQYRPSPFGLWELEYPSQNAKSSLLGSSRSLFAPQIHIPQETVCLHLYPSEGIKPKKFNQPLHSLPWSLVFIVSLFLCLTSCWWSFPTMIPFIKKLYSTFSALSLSDPGMHHLPPYLTLSVSTWQWKVNSISQGCLPHCTGGNKILIIWNSVLL